MANELAKLQKQLKQDKWALLHEMSALERQLEAAKALRVLDGDIAAVHSGLHDDALWKQKRELDPHAALGSRLEQIAHLYANLVRARSDVASATCVINDQHGELEVALKCAAEEWASARGADGTRAASSQGRYHELQSVAQGLEQKIAAIRSAARIGLATLHDSSAAKSNELSELEAIVDAAAEDVDRIEVRLIQRADQASVLTSSSISELLEHRESLSARLGALFQCPAERRARGSR